MRRYETIFITDPESSEEELLELRQKVDSILAAFKGDLLKFEDQGTKKLTYEIRKNSRGHFFLMAYASGPDLIRELERNLRLNDRVLRFQTIRISDEVSAEELKAQKEAAGPEKTARTIERPAPPDENKAGEAASPEGGEKT